MRRLPRLRVPHSSVPGVAEPGATTVWTAGRQALRALRSAGTLKIRLVALARKRARLSPFPYGRISRAPGTGTAAAQGDRAPGLPASAALHDVRQIFRDLAVASHSWLLSSSFSA